MRKSVVISLVVALLGATCGLGYIWYENKKESDHQAFLEKESLDFIKAEELFLEEKFEESLKITKKYESQFLANTESSKKWVDLVIRLSQKRKDLRNLLTLYDFLPEAFDQHEEAVILVASSYIVLGKYEEYDLLKESWMEKTTKEDEWFFLDAEKFLAQSKTDEALDLLKSKTFEGRSESRRLVRLALIKAEEDGRVAWKYLQEAYNKNPNDPDVRIYRARFLEVINKPNLARAEYGAAIGLDPKQPAYIEEMAAFHLRRKQFALALQTWALSLNEMSKTTDEIWSKMVFWNRVTIALNFDWSTATVPEGKLNPFIQYLLEMDSKLFWDEELFSTIENGKQYLGTRQETFWMRLFDFLHNKKEKEALDLLEVSTFTNNSWDYDLEVALKRVLNYRKNGKFTADSYNSPMESRHLFLKELDTLVGSVDPNEEDIVVVPDQIHNLLMSDEIFPALLTASGWLKAAVNMTEKPTLSDAYPPWYAYGLAQAIRVSEGALEALEFAKKQPQTEALSLLIGELLIASKSYQEALSQLNSFILREDRIGIRAAWLTSLIQLETRQFNQARETVAKNTPLSESVTGKETVARSYALEGDPNTARRLYVEIEQQSTEAKSYLARLAYKEKNFRKARELTEELLKINPTNLTLRKNYIRILEQEANNE